MVYSSKGTHSISPEHDTTHLPIVATIQQWRFHRHEIVQVLAVENMSPVEIVVVAVVIGLRIGFYIV